MTLFKKNKYLFLISIFLFIFFISNFSFVFGQARTYTINCTNYTPITVSSGGDISNGLNQIPETFRAAFSAKIKEYVLQWESLNATQQQQSLALLQTYYGLTCTINNNQTDTTTGASGTIDETPATSSPISFIPEYGIPGFKDKVDVSGALYGDFLKALFKYLIYLSGVFAVIIIIVSGFQWVLAGGNKSKIEGAKSRLKNALIGFVLCSSSVLILSTINTDLINIRPLNIQNIEPEIVGDAPGIPEGSYVSTSPGRPYSCPSSNLFGMFNALNGNTTYHYGGKYTHDLSGKSCEKTYCLDCSGFADFVRKCANLPSAGEECSTYFIFTYARNHNQIVKKDDTATSLGLVPGDLVGWPRSSVGEGHVLIYIGKEGGIEIFADSHGVGDTGNNSIGRWTPLESIRSKYEKNINGYYRYLLYYKRSQGKVCS